MANIFREVQLPHGYILNGKGGHGFNTTVIAAQSGAEQRNINWSQTKGKWNLGFPLRDTVDFERLIAFHRNCFGKASGFRLHDTADYSAVGQQIGTGNGATRTFQLVKNYISGPDTFVRKITKPVTASVVDNENVALANTVKIYINGVLQSSGYTVDHTTGIVTFTSAPSSSPAESITADFEFDVPVRFDTDDLEAMYFAPDRFSWPTFPIVELKI